MTGLSAESIDGPPEEHGTGRTTKASPPLTHAICR